MCRFKRGLVLVLVALTTVFYPLLAPARHRIDRSHFDKIDQGMTQAEVELIFGVPPGNYDWAGTDGSFGIVENRYVGWTFTQTKTAVFPSAKAWAGWVHSFQGHARVLQTWTGRHGSFTIGFNAEGCVVFKGGSETRIVAPWWRWWPK